MARKAGIDWEFIIFTGIIGIGMAMVAAGVFANHVLTRLYPDPCTQPQTEQVK